MDDTGGVDILQSTENLVEEILYELLLKRSGGKETVEISAEELGDEVAEMPLVAIRGKMWCWWHIHILERGDEDVGEGDDLGGCQWCNRLIVQEQLTFSCLRCLRSLSSLYVRLDNTGVLNGFMIFLIATFCPVSWSLAELQRQSCQRSPSLEYSEHAYHTRPNAPMPTGWRSEYLVVHQYTVVVGVGLAECCPAYLEVYSVTLSANSPRD